MNRMKKDISEKTLLKRARRQRLKYITILPSLVTIINGVCGFAAINLACNSKFSTACFMIFLAMIADMLDGQLARRVESTSNFGGQLDSLCDIISFGVAPAFIMLKVIESELHLEPSGLPSENFLHRFIWVAAVTYTCCTAIRLARFNVENEDSSFDHMSFVGLPSPAAAGVIVSTILFQQKHLESFLLLNKIVISSLPFVALAVGFLMVSRVRYPHILNHYLRGKKPFTHFILFLLLIALVLQYPQAILVVIFWGFALTRIIHKVFNFLTRRRSEPQV
jgi:CDP-diacylglycerol---serine O-phosphatidyltransferase